MEGDLLKDEEIDSGGEATLYRAEYQGNVVAVRKFRVPFEARKRPELERQLVLDVSGLRLPPFPNCCQLF